jgi:phage baseplate assembly protein W
MALGLSLPITLSSTDGFTLLYGVKETLKQNFAMLILTNPGERVMEPDFGVGIKAFLFNNKSQNYRQSITDKIHQQVQKYIPAIVIRSIEYAEPEQFPNSISIRITYSIPDMSIQDLLELTI